MKSWKGAGLAGVVASLAVFAVGCGDFWQAPSNTGGGSGSSSTTTLSSGIFYVLNEGTTQVVAMSINSGVLTTIGSYPLAAKPLAMALAPSGNFLYVSTYGGIYVYSVASDGGLTEENGNQPISPDQAGTLQVDATNGWLIDGVSGVAQLNAIALNSSTGLLATSAEKEQTVALPTNSSGTSVITQLAISPTDSSSCNSCYVFVGMKTGGMEFVGFNPGNANPFGGAGHVAVINSGGGDNAMAVDPSNRLLYVGESNALSSATQSGGLRVFSIGSGSITEISGSPFSTGGTGPSAILAQADYVYVANEAVSGSSVGNIGSFSLTAGGTTSAPTYTIASIGTAAAGTTPLSLAADSTGNFLLTTNSGEPDLQGYTMSAGVLTSVLTGPTGTDPVQAFAIVAAQ
jgi:6-phosphogluconolactonase (cycloisomerase 2 family)